MRLAEKGHWETFLGDEHVLYLPECSSTTGYMFICTCQKELNCLRDVLLKNFFKNTFSSTLATLFFHFYL